MREWRRESRARELFVRRSGTEAAAVALGRSAVALALAACCAAAVYAADVALGYASAARTQGTLAVPGLRSAVRIVRDDRDVPHIEAATAGDAAFAQGFVAASDRLFQMELSRRFAYGTLAEVFGPKALPIDRERRYYDVRDAARRQWAACEPAERAELSRYADGVNAAIATQPLPVEFRLLQIRPGRWSPVDSLAVSLAVSIELADSWHDVLVRDDAWRRYGPARYERIFPLSGIALERSGARLGSNAWAAGGRRTKSGRALLANDPHLALTIPGLWYLIDVRAPGLHVAGAAIPGAPGVLLGHNERVAWGATNADTSPGTLYRTAALPPRGWVTERFRVRFGADQTARYYRTDRAFGVPDPYDAQRLVLVRWPFLHARSPVAAIARLDRAADAAGALESLRSFAGAGENFVVADVRGDVAYHLAGTVVRDPAWGRYVLNAGQAPARPDVVPYDALPSVAPSRGATIVSANDRMYGANYPLRLAAAFEPPYRAMRIRELLAARDRFDASYFARMQLDTVSLADRRFARMVSAYLRAANDPRDGDAARTLSAWNGDFSPRSDVATLEHRLRIDLGAQASSENALFTALAQGRPPIELAAELHAALEDRALRQPWMRSGAVAIEHPLAPLRLPFLNGAVLPGDGDEYTVHVQQEGFAQSLRAVWEPGNWNAGGIAIPSGESGEPGSGHYTDLSADWVAGTLRPLPFGDAAVRAAARATLVLLPPG